MRRQHRRHMATYSIVMCFMALDVWMCMSMLRSGEPTWRVVEAGLFVACVMVAMFQMRKTDLAFLIPLSYLLWVHLLNRFMGWGG